MNFWDDMVTQAGFSDGEAVPAEAEKARELYVRTVNHLAEKLGSGFRCTAFNRPGMHNWCLVKIVPAHLLDTSKFLLNDCGHFESVQDGELQHYEEEFDEAFLDAINTAKSAALDEYLEVTIAVSPNFDLNFMQIIEKAEQRYAEGD